MSCLSGGVPMGFFRPEWGGDGTTGSLKRKFRWFFRIEAITGDVDSALPCIRASRPKLNFREMQAEHLNETIFFPSKPEWQPIQLTLYDRCINSYNPIFSWLKQQYNPDAVACSAWYPTLDPLSFKTCGFLELYDGCGNVIESWILEQIYPQNIDWGELDMGNEDVVTVDFSLRYDRASQLLAANQSTDEHVLYSSTNCSTCTNFDVCPQPIQQGSPGNTGGTTGPTPNISIIPPPSPGESPGSGSSGSNLPAANLPALDLRNAQVGQPFYNSALGNVTPYTTPGGTVYKDSNGDYWSMKQRATGTVYYKWNGSDWGQPTLTPRLLQFVPQTVPDFIMF